MHNGCILEVTVSGGLHQHEHDLHHEPSLPDHKQYFSHKVGHPKHEHDLHHDPVHPPHMDFLTISVFLLCSTSFRFRTWSLSSCLWPSLTWTTSWCWPLFLYHCALLILPCKKFNPLPQFFSLSSWDRIFGYIVWLHFWGPREQRQLSPGNQALGHLQGLGSEC